MTQKSIIIFVLLLFSTNIYAQEKGNFFFNNFTAGTSLTYVRDVEIYGNTYTGAPGEYIYNDFTWNINFATSLSKNVQLGVQVLNIFSSGTRVDNEYNKIYGMFVQYDFLHKTPYSVKMFIDMSINKGNYCTCDILDPYTKEGLWYHGMGAGVELPLKRISKRLFVDLSFYNYIILNKIEIKWNFTQYIVGLNYHLGKPLKN